MSKVEKNLNKDELLKIVEYIKLINPETPAEDIKIWMLNQKDAVANQEQLKPKEENTIFECVLNKNKKIAFSKIFELYKTRLITRKDKEDVKNYLLNNNYIIKKENKDGRVMYYTINKEKEEDFSKWINENLIIQHS